MSEQREPGETPAQSGAQSVVGAEERAAQPAGQGQPSPSSQPTQPTQPAPPTPPAMRAVTISREYGSGGGEIAARLARRLGWRLVDHEMVTQIARRLGVDEADIEARDEQAESRIAQLMTGMQMVGPAITLPAGLPAPTAGSYARALRDVTREAVATDHVVIVGRGSQVILQGRRDTLHVRVVAPIEQRVAYVARRENLDPAVARQRIYRKDQDRRRYLTQTYGRTPDDDHLYDLVVNTAVLDLESCVSIALLALERKGARLGAPASALGAGANLAPYSAPPADFTVPARAEDAAAGDDPAATHPGGGADD